MLRDVAKLARKVEKAGGPPQGTALASFANAMAKDDIDRAMQIRDGVKRDLASTKEKNSGDWVEVGLLVACLGPLVGFFGILTIGILRDLAVWVLFR
jgi:hypothetical protein